MPLLNGATTYSSSPPSLLSPLCSQPIFLVCVSCIPSRPNMVHLSDHLGVNGDLHLNTNRLSCIYNSNMHSGPFPSLLHSAAGNSPTPPLSYPPPLSVDDGYLSGGIWLQPGSVYTVQARGGGSQHRCSFQ